MLGRLTKNLKSNSNSNSYVDDIIKIAVLAVGGQGGGVLSSWIIDLAHRNNFHVQSTSIAGVAQRTGATIYYLEMLPKKSKGVDIQPPVFSLSPASGDVDIVLAAELMEAGRAIMRGFVTPERTLLITSTHRTYATMEKTAPGDAIANSELVLDTAGNSSSELIAFDMDKIAVEAGTVISASLFGALAGSGKLPFSDQSYIDTIEASGRGVSASLKAFAAALEIAKQKPEPRVSSIEPLGSLSSSPKIPAKLSKRWEEVQSRILSLPIEVQPIVQAGIRKVADFQDLEYGEEYLQRVSIFLSRDQSEYALTITAAKYIANAMAYDDIIRVADIKTRRHRFERINDENGVSDKNTLHITEYFHPGANEVCSMLPLKLGQFIERRPKLFKLVDRVINRGWRVRTDTIFWFSVLYMVSGMRRFRRKFLRHKVEQEHLENLTKSALSKVDENYSLAVEVMKCQRLIKGYSDTHQRGLSKFGKVMGGIELVKLRDDAAEWAQRLRDAALADVEGAQLEGALKTIGSFTGNND